MENYFIDSDTRFLFCWLSTGKLRWRLDLFSEQLHPFWLFCWFQKFKRLPFLGFKLRSAQIKTDFLHFSLRFRWDHFTWAQGGSRSYLGKTSSGREFFWKIHSTVGFKNSFDEEKINPRKVQLNSWNLLFKYKIEAWILKYLLLEQKILGFLIVLWAFDSVKKTNNEIISPRSQKLTEVRLHKAF